MILKMVQTNPVIVQWLFNLAVLLFHYVQLSASKTVKIIVHKEWTFMFDGIQTADLWSRRQSLNHLCQTFELLKNLYF